MSGLQTRTWLAAVAAVIVTAFPAALVAAPGENPASGDHASSHGAVGSAGGDSFGRRP